LCISSSPGGWQQDKAKASRRRRRTFEIYSRFDGIEDFNQDRFEALKHREALMDYLF